MTTRTQTTEILETRSAPLPLYHTIIHNCACHTFDDVIVGLIRIVGMSPQEARRKAAEVDFYGSGIAATANLEVAEMYAQRLHDEVVSAGGTLLRTSVSRAV